MRKVLNYNALWCDEFLSQLITPGFPPCCVMSRYGNSSQSNMLACSEL